MFIPCFKFLFVPLLWERWSWLANISSVQFSRSVMSDSVTPWTAACQASLSITNSQSPPKPHPTISSSIVSFSSCPQSFPASGSFPMSQLFASGGQSIGVQLQHFLCLPIWALKFGEAKWVIVNNRNASDISPSTQSWKGQSFTRVLLSCCNNLPHAVWQSLYPSSPSVTIERGLLPICIPVQ